MNKSFLAVLFVASFSVLLGTNQGAHAGGCIDNDGDKFFIRCGGPVEDCDDFDRNVYPGHGCPDNGQVIGGEIIPIDSTVLYIAGIQTSVSLLIPAVLSAAGIGLILARIK